MQAGYARLIIECVRGLFQHGLLNVWAYERHCSLPALAGAAMLLRIAAKKLFCRVSEDSASSLEGIGKPMQKAALFHMPP
jgi:hypothetical protein